MSSGSAKTNDAKSIFGKAHEIDAASERAAYLDQACGGDATLRAEVERLLAAAAQAGRFMEGPAVATVQTAAFQRVTEGPGTVIGPYKLMEQIGEGGFGLVFVAEQHQPVRRKVALKVIKPGMDTRDVIARFEAERQALALMDHPNIARVFDAGAIDSGRPYFVMELVRGIPITEYCDEQHLTPRERLDLFVSLCHAIQHAHQKGIIHRDVKPTNVLVTLHDGRPVVKVIDFGVAKALSQQLTERTIYTQFAQMIGTPLYMSPEQAAMSGLDIDTRSDIYSMGVLLYELLTGSTPFDRQRLRTAAADEIRRIIREEEPLKPSTWLSQSGERLASIAALRNTEAAKLSKLVRGDLDWIVMTRLEKDRNRRYETANGLARDVERYLHDEPVVARPPSNLYRFRKLVRRNKVVFIAASAVLAALVLGLGISTQLLLQERAAHRRAVAAEQEQERLRYQAESEEQKAKNAAAKSEQVASLMKDMLHGVGPSVALGRDTTMLREILDRMAERLDQLDDQPAVNADLRATLGNVYRELGDYGSALTMHHEALVLRKQQYGEEHPDVAQSLHDLAQVLYGQGKWAESEAMHRKALALRRTLFGEEHLDVATSLSSLAEAIRRRSVDTAEAEPLQRQALALRKKLLGEEHPDVARSLNDLGLILKDQRRHRESEAMHRQALAMRRKLFGKEHPEVATSLHGLGLSLITQRKYTEAEATYREALAMQKKLFGDEHPDIGHSLHNLARALQGQGKLADAERLARESLAMRRQLLGNEHRDVAHTLINLATTLRAQGKLAEAEMLHREEVEIRKKLHGNEHPQLAVSLGRLAGVLRAQGKLEEADAVVDRARDAIARKSLIDKLPNAASAIQRLSRSTEPSPGLRNPPDEEQGSQSFDKADE